MSDKPTTAEKKIENYKHEFKRVCGERDKAEATIARVAELPSELRKDIRQTSDGLWSAGFNTSNRQCANIIEQAILDKLCAS